MWSKFRLLPQLTEKVKFCKEKIKTLTSSCGLELVRFLSLSADTMLPVFIRSEVALGITGSSGFGTVSPNSSDLEVILTRLKLLLRNKI